MVSSSGRSTRPWIMSLCCAGSMSGRPAWWRSKNNPFGVMMPCRSCSGEKLTEDSALAVSQGTLRRMTEASVSAGRP